ncbi:DNA helicase RecQ [Marinicrinis lubricantis]|uniref:DNA helicase RecQ n=1 Tax=Marinicrinis lubricantis TaxID=2086470 RepID=A0ABW1IJK2_9BACL
MIAKAREHLKKYFGYEQFRKGQEQLIAAILDQRDALGVMPTGAGKSVCYQIPASILHGVTLVISPLISLMKDQVDTLNQIGIPTTLINSSLSAEEVDQRFKEIREGHYKVLYIAPERLDSGRFIHMLKQIHVPLIAVDEAHCISQWGHDFRPSYLHISKLVQSIEPRPVIAAFTATATDKVKDDIVRCLGLLGPERVTTGYARDNLTFSVYKGIDKRKFISDYVKHRQEESGIIYASTRKEVDDCHRYLTRLGIKAGKYHAGLSDTERMESQEQFLYDDIRVMVATNAFGMGIDKSNVRYVIHYNMPRNLEAYYQEAGRAGRDGEPGECILLYAAQDTATQKYLIEMSDADTERKTQEYNTLNTMVEYCHTPDCLQKYIVRYFGQEEFEPCGKCSSCTDERDLSDITIEAQKIFSCVFKMNQRFGVTLTAKVLKGSQDKKVKQFGFDRISTYGVMKEYTEKEIVQMIQVLTAEGYLKMSDSQYPVISLTTKVKPVLSEQEKVYQRLMKTPTDAPSYISSWSQALFEELRLLRKSIAEQEKTPPFTIFHDATLREMSEMAPTSEHAFMEIKGVGERKFQKYGRSFLYCIQQFLDEHEPE